jgi:hypothetical protein
MFGVVLTPVLEKCYTCDLGYTGVEIMGLPPLGTVLTQCYGTLRTQVKFWGYDGVSVTLTPNTVITLKLDLTLSICDLLLESLLFLSGHIKKHYGREEGFSNSTLNTKITHAIKYLKNSNANNVNQ